MEFETSKAEQATEGRQGYGAFQNNIYREGYLHSRIPLVTTSPTNLEAQAKRHLGDGAFNYVAGGAGDNSRMDANRLAFRQWKILPRMLKPTTPRNLKVNLFGDVYGEVLRDWCP